MAGAFSPEDPRRFAKRPWGEVRRAKEAYWAAMAPARRLALVSDMAQHLRATDPSRVDAAHRRVDLEHHLELAGKIRRVAHVFARR